MKAYTLPDIQCIHLLESRRDGGNLPTMQETRIQPLGGEEPLEKETAAYCSTLAWEISQTGEPARLQSTGLQRVGHS